MGVPVKTVLPMTTFEQTETIISELQEKGVKDLNVRMTGWANGGVRQKVLTSVHTLNELGGDRGMKKLIAFAKDKGINLTPLPYIDYIILFVFVQ